MNVTTLTFNCTTDNFEVAYTFTLQYIFYQLKKMKNEKAQNYPISYRVWIFN